MSNKPHQPLSDLSKSIVFAIIGSLCLSLMALCAKLASPHTTDPVITFFRFGITGIYVGIILIIRHYSGRHITLKTNQLGMHLLRAIASSAAMYSLYFSLHYIPLVNANLLTLTYPLFALILTTIFYKEKTRKSSWIAMIIGFIGISFILKPTSSLFQIASGIGLFSGLAAALGILGIRELSKHEHTYTIMFYYTIISLILSGILIIFFWKTPDSKTVLELFGVGIFGMFYQEFLTRALSYAPPYIPTSLMYLSVVFSSIFGVLIWGYIPDYLSWIGILLVCVGNIAVIMRK